VLSEPVETSFPGRLGTWLQVRWLAGLPGVTILPCELIEGNGAKLRAMLEAAMPDSEFQSWLDTECTFCETLVDRICTQGEAGSLAAIVEPYCFWAIAGKNAGALGKLADASGGGILLTDDLPRYMLRKVRILNGLHTAMASIAPNYGIETVREALEHPELGPFLETALWDEILPAICPPLDKSDAESFANVTLSRMRNPFLEHKLSAISVGAETKWHTRLLPTMAEFEKRFGKPPEKLTRCRAAFLEG
jgi:tagaturonate reductase